MILNDASEICIVRRMRCTGFAIQWVGVGELGPLPRLDALVARLGR